MVRTLLKPFRQARSKVLGEYKIGYQTSEDRYYPGGLSMPLCEARDGKPQEAIYRFDQTAAYVRSKIK